jgi:hypothetical protein
LSDAAVVREQQLLIENLEVTSYFASDHSTNVLMDVRGQLPRDKEAMLSSIARYLGLSEEEQLNFRFGTLLGFFGHQPNYRSFKEFFIRSKREAVTVVIQQLEGQEAGRTKELVAEFNRMLI